MPTSLYLNYYDDGGESAGIATIHAHQYIRDASEGGGRGICSYIDVIIPDDTPVTWPAVEAVIREAYQQIGHVESDFCYTEDVPSGRLHLLLHDGSPSTADHAFSLLRHAAMEVMQRGRTIELSQ